MKLPPMNSLRVFEVTSRRAGALPALPIKNLENHLSLQLFERPANSLKLTEGRAAFPTVQEGFLFWQRPPISRNCNTPSPDNFGAAIDGDHVAHSKPVEIPQTPPGYRGSGRHQGEAHDLQDDEI
jgi:hypothetical protein